MFNVRGAFDGESDSHVMQLVDVVTMVQFESEQKMVQVNQCLLDTDNTNAEFLLQPHQLRDYGVIVNDVSRTHLGPGGELGKQSITVGETTYPLSFDGCLVIKLRTTS